MAGFSTFIIFTSVLCQLSVTTTSGTLKEVVGALGGSVTFTLNFTEFHTVVWTFNTFSIAIIAKDNVIVLQNHNKERIIFPDGSSLKLSQLKKNDSGVYRAEIHRTSFQSPFTQEYKLYVYENLSTPKVTMDGQANKNGTCTTKLTCSMEEGGDNVTYSWKAIGQGVNEFHDGAILPISWKSGEKDKTLICMARNPISHSSSAPILAQNLCEDSANDLRSSNFILYILPGAIVFSVMLVMTIPFAIRTERRKGSKGDTEKVDNHQEKPNFCPHLEDNAEYGTISYINERSLEDDAANTLYSTVQIPKAVKSPSSLSAVPHM
ncbi:SLAM family member 7 [Phodopus roborovskii]|uniref:Slamf7 protein n=1 Tax=Phodopus roborovskii TaxID=109678 RepID=A0AAU9Z9X6_PHORO|nr:SLAM family member 7 [Phodopus roborovskii]CAH6789489.1 Slamf7 [Phodopus roborovskii]